MVPTCVCVMSADGKDVLIGSSHLLLAHIGDDADNVDDDDDDGVLEDTSDLDDDDVPVVGTKKDDDDL